MSHAIFIFYPPSGTTAISIIKGMTTHKNPWYIKMMYGILAIVVIGGGKGLIRELIKGDKPSNVSLLDSSLNYRGMFNIDSIKSHFHFINTEMFDFSNLSLTEFDKKDTSLINLKNRISFLTSDKKDSIKIFARIYIEFMLALQKDEIIYLNYKSRGINKQLLWNVDTYTLYDSLKNEFYFDEMGIYEMHRKNEFILFAIPLELGVFGDFKEEATKLKRRSKINAYKNYSYLFD